jgi:hypothetical protein
LICVVANAPNEEEPGSPAQKRRKVGDEIQPVKIKISLDLNAQGGPRQIQTPLKPLSAASASTSVRFEFARISIVRQINLAMGEMMKKANDIPYLKSAARACTCKIRIFIIFFGFSFSLAFFVRLQ